MQEYLLEWRRDGVTATYVTNDALWCTVRPPRGDCPLVEANRRVLQQELGTAPRVYDRAKVQPERPNLIFVVEAAPDEVEPPAWFILDDGTNKLVALPVDVYRARYAERFAQDEALDDDVHTEVAHEAMNRVLKEAIREFVSYRVPEWWQEVVEEILDRDLEEALLDVVASRAHEEGWMFLWKGDQLDVPLAEALREALEEEVTVEALELEPERFRALVEEKDGALPPRLLRDAPPLVSRTFYV